MSIYENFMKELVQLGIATEIIEKLIDEYKIVKKEAFLGNNEKTILHSAKVADLILALIKNKVTGIEIDIDKIHFDVLFREIINYPKPTSEEVILTLAIPRVAQSVYTIRSKTDVAHVKSINPTFIDSTYCDSACDWMLSEIALLFYTSNPKEAGQLITSLISKKIPIIEEFEDNSHVILRTDLSFTQEILLTLYHYYPKRITSAELFRKYGSTTVYPTLKRLEKQRLVHKSDEGYKLTKLGLSVVDETILN